MIDFITCLFVFFIGVGTGCFCRLIVGKNKNSEAEKVSDKAKLHIFTTAVVCIDKNLNSLRDRVESLEKKTKRK